MKIILIADDDSQVCNLKTPKADILISLGDMHTSTIIKATCQYDVKHTLAVKGNHDLPNSFPTPIIDLHKDVISIYGGTFGGFAGSWQYKPKGHYLYTQDEVHRALLDFPPVDVFISHNSPRGCHERDLDVHQGFEAYNDYIQRHQPQYFIHGHQHINKTSQIGKTTVMGVFGEKMIELP